MSVLTNAYDANKQVVFLASVSSAGRRQVIARQLVAVSRGFQLLGYNTYVNDPGFAPAYVEQLNAAVARFVGRLAARSNLELAEEGAPEPIGDHFWWDDDAVVWPETARAACSQNRAEAELPATC